jgi:predicted membrane protein
MYFLVGFLYLFVVISIILTILLIYYIKLYILRRDFGRYIEQKCDKLLENNSKLELELFELNKKYCDLEDENKYLKESNFGLQFMLDEYKEKEKKNRQKL